MGEDNGKTRRPRVCVDLDGVLNLYDGWKGEDHFAALRPGAAEFLRRLNADGFEVVVLTTRDPAETRCWLLANGIGDLVERVTNKKLPAVAYVDDRAIRFEGLYVPVLESIRKPPHWRKPKGEPTVLGPGEGGEALARDEGFEEADHGSWRKMRD